jgi:hypothetical protein
MSMLINNQLNGKFRLKNIIEDGKSEQELRDQNKKIKFKQVDVLHKIGDYFNPKIIIK